MNKIFTCLICNKIFNDRPSRLRRFCSYSCFWTSRRGKNVMPYNFKCTNCGIEKRIRPSHLKRRKFCSMKCYAQSIIGKPKPWLKGKKFSPEHIQKLVLSRIGRKGKLSNAYGHKVSIETKKRMSISHRKIKPEKWDGFISSIDKIERVKFRREVQKSVFERDNYTCQLCFKKGGFLQVDHIQSWAKYIEFRFNIENCRTLCMNCHYQITFGKEKPVTIKNWGHNLKHNVSI